jgi:hypothetical protein
MVVAGALMPLAVEGALLRMVVAEALLERVVVEGILLVMAMALPMVVEGGTAPTLAGDTVLPALVERRRSMDPQEREREMVSVDVGNLQTAGRVVAS